MNLRHQAKNLNFVFILLLILPLTGCKNVVKQTDVEKPALKGDGLAFIKRNDAQSSSPNSFPSDFTGKGTRTFPNGDKYVGEFKNGKENGKRSSSDGRNYYVGEWEDGKEHSQRTFT